ncbi:MAG TPA: WYL domain-containing protein, partial [Bacteroidales bacterium]|nr:WYL domain-containing protein [Bacteroidales bacterium]
MDQPKLERLLRLMKMLTANNTYTVEDISERLEISVRTVYRYIDTFRNAGFVIKKKDDVIKLDTSSPYFKDISELVHFTEEEAYILKSAIESIDENNLLKQNLKKKLYTVYDYKILADTIVSGKNASNVKSLVDAISEKKQVILHKYSSAHGNRVSDRQVEPFAFTTNYIQVWCYEPESKSNKLFKVARMSGVEILKNQWQFEPSHKAGFIDIFRMHSDKLLPVKMTLSVRAVNLLLEEYPLAAQHISMVDENSWLLETNVCSYEGAGRFVLGLMDDISEIQPPAFREFLISRVKKIEKKL